MSKLQNLNRDVNSAQSACSGTLRLTVSLTKKQKKSGGKDQLLHERSLYHWVVCLQILIRENLFYGKLENLDRNTPSNSPRARGTKLKIRERKGPSRGIVRKCVPHECSPCAPEFEERTPDKTLHQERCARRVAWNLAKNVYKLKNKAKATFYSPIEARAMLAPTSKSPKERESRASMHMLSEKGFELRRKWRLCGDPGTPQRW